jgi:polyisoprenoid-binding protein YceI
MLGFNKGIKMKNLYRFLVLGTLVTCFAGASFAADYTIDPTHSSINFTIKHLVSKVNGRFNDFSGTFSFDPKKLGESKADVTIKTASISTENDKRDTHLKSADFFDVEKFPTITFKAKKVTAAGKDKFKLVGDVTMHGVTKEETFDIEFGGAAKDPWGNMRSGFTATSKLNRKDFGIIWNKTLDNGGYMLGDDVAIVLQLEGTEVKAAAAAK